MNKWENKDGKLFSRIKFKDFAEALEFVNKVGALAEQVNHHPDITFGWGYVEISLFSHSEDKITTKDKELASIIDRLC